MDASGEKREPSGKDEKPCPERNLRTHRQAEAEVAERQAQTFQVHVLQRRSRWSPLDIMAESDRTQDGQLSPHCIVLLATTRSRRLPTQWRGKGEDTGAAPLVSGWSAVGAFEAYGRTLQAIK